MKIKLNNMITIITGGGSGIGRSAAELFAQAGAHVIVTDINKKSAKYVSKLIRSKQGKSEGHLLDVTSLKNVNIVINKIINDYKRIDILINCAGIIPRTQLDEITSKEWEKVFAINVKGVFYTSRAVMKQMKLQNFGIIINIASVAGKKGAVLAGVHYAATKAAVISLTQSFATHLCKSGVRVNAVSPGPVQTSAIEDIKKEESDLLKKSVPIGRIAEPIEIANVILFLASDMSKYITGEIVDVDGGATMD